MSRGEDPLLKIPFGIEKCCRSNRPVWGPTAMEFKDGCLGQGKREVVPQYLVTGMGLGRDGANGPAGKNPTLLFHMEKIFSAVRKSRAIGREFHQATSTPKQARDKH